MVLALMLMCGALLAGGEDERAWMLDDPEARVDEVQADGLLVRAWIDRSPIVPGEPIEIELELVNTSDEAYVVPRDFGRLWGSQGAPGCLDVELSINGAESVPYLSWISCYGAVPQGMLHMLEPGCRHRSLGIVLTDWVDAGESQIEHEDLESGSDCLIATLGSESVLVCGESFEFHARLRFDAPPDRSVRKPRSGDGSPEETQDASLRIESIELPSVRLAIDWDALPARNAAPLADLDEGAASDR